VDHMTAKCYEVFDFNDMAHSETMDMLAQGPSGYEEMQKSSDVWQSIART